MQTNLDVKRLLCPMPVIRLGEMIEKIEIGDTIQIIATDSTRYFSCQQSFLGLRDLCINRNNHQKPTFHPLGDFLNPASDNCHRSWCFA
jgi:hypothetical protein